MSRLVRFIAGATLLICILGQPYQVRAQLTVSDSLGVNELIETLIGSGVDVFNLNITCDTTFALREFDGNAANLGLGRGLLMSTGLADSAIGPNTSPSASLGGALGAPGYAPLDVLSGQTTFDACVIEFDIIPYCDSIGIRYIFASDEYHEFVASSTGGIAVNDAFAFFISGPGFPGALPGQNIALVPGTTTPVSINNINNGYSMAGSPSTGPCTNCAYFVDNVGGTTVEYDGFTTPLLAAAAVTPCQTYHITLAIADASDGIYDSGVFIEAAGIGCVTPQLQLGSLDNLGGVNGVYVEGCLNTGLLTFTLAQPLPDTVGYGLTYGGTATMGADYQTLPDTLIFPAGQTTILLPFTLFQDPLVEGQETLVISFEDSTLCGTVFRDSIVLYLRDAPQASVSDTFLCGGVDSLPIGDFPAIPGYTYAWSPGGNLSDTTASQPLLSLSNLSPNIDTQLFVLTVIAYPGQCEARDTGQFVISPDLAGQVTIDPLSACANDSLLFGFVSAIDSLTPLFWDFGDGTQSTLAIPSHSYGLSGTYPVTLLISDQLGCQDSVVDSMQVQPDPDVTFLADDVCAGQASVFVLPNGPQSGVSYLWDFGDGSTIDIPAPTHLYAQPDTYAVTLVATNAFGCRDTATVPVVVHPNPVAGFSSQDACPGAASVLLDQSTPGSAPLSTFLWTIAGGTTLSGDSIAVTFATAGPQVITLAVADPFGCVDTLTDTLTVFPAPMAAFGGDSVCVDAPLTFADSSTAASPLQIWQWDFGDGNASSQPQPTHAYAAPGSYPVSLAVSDARGCSDTVLQAVTVLALPDVTFAQDPACDGVPIQFAGNRPVLGETYLWTLGDETTSLQPNPSHLYPGPGTYAVQLQVTNAFGCRDSSSDTTEVYRLPKAEFTADSVCQGTPTTFVNRSQPGDFGLAEYDWGFGDLSPPGTQANPVHVYQTLGLITVALQVTDSFGCVVDTAQLVQVWARPEVAFATDTACAETELQFTDASTTPDLSRLVSWRWDLGQGGSVSGPEALVSYEQPGSYAVELLVSTEHGCRDSLTQQVLVYPVPELSFTYESNCALDTISFTSSIGIDQSQGSDQVGSWRWDWGDGQQSGSLLNPGHLYSEPGDYVVSLSASSQRGCADTFSTTVAVYPVPVLPRLLPDTVCVGEAALLATIPDNGETIYWYDDYAAQQPFQQTNRWLTEPLIESQRYYVEAVNAEGCRSPRALITAVMHPDANPALLTDANVVERPDALVNFRVGTQVPMAAYQWDFGDGIFSQQPQPAHPYAQPGFYEVQLSLTDVNGCRYTAGSSIEVKELINLSIPSAFTPNGDGSNDQFFIGQHLMRSLDFVVYNRWGRVVFQTSNLDFRWDGRDLQGQALPEGVYVYRVIAQDLDGGIVRQGGSITLFR
jgi:gliding motility-associated-like protein